MHSYASFLYGASIPERKEKKMILRILKKILRSGSSKNTVQY